MRIFRHHTELPPEARGAAVALGNFDGVHRGHKAVIAEAGRIACAEGMPHGVITFEPHPRRLFRPDDPPFRLSTLRTKSHWIAATGADMLFVLPFDRNLADKGPEAFVKIVLCDGLGVRHVVIGHNFRFGQGRSGTPELLADLGRREGFEVTRMAAVQGMDGAAISSTRIRECLRQGDPAAAARLLGQWWELEGRVLHGQKRGRTIGFPTANVDMGEQLVPAVGVYAVRAAVDEGATPRWYDGVANLGRRPTVDGLRLSFEVHLFDFAGDLYGKHLRVRMIGFIRPERKFDGLDALKAQIADAAAVARKILSETGEAATPRGGATGAA